MSITLTQGGVTMSEPRLFLSEQVYPKVEHEAGTHGFLGVQMCPFDSAQLAHPECSVRQHLFFDASGKEEQHGAFSFCCKDSFPPLKHGGNDKP